MASGAETLRANGRGARAGLGIRHRCLSRLRLTVRAGAQRRERDAEAVASHGLKGSLQNFILKTKESREKALKGALSTSIALTQVVAGGSSALANSSAMLQLQGDGQQQQQQVKAVQQEAAFAQQSVVAPSVTAGEGGAAPSEKTQAAASQAKEVDLYRDTLVRYAGYANEVGESFKNLVSTSAYRMSYAIAICYVLADATDKGLKAENVAIAAEVDQAKVGQEHEKNPQFEAAIAAADTLVWQGLASVIIPGYTINRIVWAAKKLSESDAVSKLPPMAKKWAPTLVGLSCIPFIVHPIDTGVTMLLENTIRHLY